MSSEVAFLFLRTNCKKQSTGEERVSLSSFALFPFQNSDRAETQRHLDALRSNLRDLNCNLDEMESSFGSSTKIEVESDALIVETLRRRMQSLNESNKELNVRCQRLDAQYKGEYTDLWFH